MFTRVGQPMSLHCDPVCGGGVREGTVLLAPLSAGFQSLPPPTTHNQIEPFWCWFPGGWVCIYSRTQWVSSMNSPVRLGVSLTATSTPTGVFSQRFWGFISLHWSPGLHSLSGTPLVPPCLSALGCGTDCSTSHQLAGPGPPATASPWVLSARLPISIPPTSLDECFFFNSLVVGLLYSSIFCQFWFFVFKFVLLLFVRGGTVCLPVPSSWPEVSHMRSQFS